MMFKENLVVSVKAGGNYLTDKGNKILMPFGTEYSLFFRNKDVRRVAIGPITIDGKDILDGKRMVLDAAEDWTLEGAIRDTDDSYRFKFIERTKKISNHRDDDPEDGLISVSFQYEKIKSTFHKMRERRINGDGHGFLHSMNIGGHDSAPIATYSASSASTMNVGSVSNLQHQAQPEAEAGITVDGNHINHSYNTTVLNGMEAEQHNLLFGIYGYTESAELIKESITSKTKLICNTCGTKSSYNTKFCPECGTNLH